MVYNTFLNVIRKDLKIRLWITLARLARFTLYYVIDYYIY